MLSEFTVIGAAAETFWSCQSVGAVFAAVGLQTGSLNVAVARLPDTVKLVKVGRVVSAYAYGRAFDAEPPVLVTVTLTVPTTPAGEVVVSEPAPQLVTAAVLVPKLTVGNAGVQTKFAPAITTVVPPALEPEAGVSDEIDAAVPDVPTVAAWK